MSVRRHKIRKNGEVVEGAENAPLSTPAPLLALVALLARQAAQAAAVADHDPVTQSKRASRE
jgi:hypothetical protein